MTRGMPQGVWHSKQLQPSPEKVLVSAEKGGEVDVKFDGNKNVTISIQKAPQITELISVKHHVFKNFFISSHLLITECSQLL